MKHLKPVSTDTRPFLSFEYGDPMPYLVELDKELQNLGILLEIIDDGGSDIHYRLYRYGR